MFETRIGISSGVSFLGNMGTYDKMSVTAIGAAVNLGGRIEPQATPRLCRRDPSPAGVLGCVACSAGVPVRRSARTIVATME
jgi:hypothetical protein